ncbi:MAG: cyclic nucleotide-binding domain-containing protein [Aggregatilineales bacterium]
MSGLTRLLRAIPLFAGLTDDQLAQIATIAQPETYSAGETILSQRARGDCMYLIAEGQVQVSINQNKTQSTAALYLGPGQVFGEVALLDRGTRSADVVADEDGTVVYRLEREPIEQLCHADTQLGYVLMRNLAIDLAFKLRHSNAAGGI